MQPQEAAIPTLRETLVYLARLALLIRPYWKGLVTSLALGLVIGAVAMLSPLLSKLFIDEVYPSRDVALLQVLVIGVVVLSVAGALMEGIRAYFSQVIGVKLSAATNLLFLNHLQHVPLRFYDTHRVGEVISRFGDVRSALNTVTGLIHTLFVSGIYLLVVPPFLLLINWQLALVSLMTVPITVGVSTATGRLLRGQWRRSAEASAELSAFQVETISNARTFKTMGAEHYVYRTAAAQVDEIIATQLRANGFAVVVSMFNGCVRAAGTAIFTWYAWTLILSGRMTLGDFVAFAAYLGFFTGPVRQVAGLFNTLQQAAISLGRMFEYLDAPVEQDPVRAYSPPPPTKRARGELRLSNVTFGYSPERDALRDISLTIDPGTITAVVGPSGAGKSSLLRLLCRLNDPDMGVITMDGVPTASMPISALRAQIAVVWQEVGIVRGTVWENLTLGLDDVPADLVLEAVRIAQLDAVVRDLPDGFETPVAEWGASLSGGQRQRLAIARALIRDTPILLLDEATSQVDVFTEEELFRSLFPRIRDRTTLVVTHRIGTAMLADRIVVIDEGRVVGEGVHRDLLQSCDVYRRLVRAAGITSEARQLRVAEG